MTTHVRQQIRDYLVTALTGLTTTGSRVFKSRPLHRQLQTSELPALLIYTDGEDVSADTMGGPLGQIERTLRVRIEAVVRGTSAFDDNIDLIIKEVEIALNASNTVFTLNNLSRRGIVLQAVEDPEFDGEGDKVVGRVAMTWVAIYRTVANAPATAI